MIVKRKKVLRSPFNFLIFVLGLLFIQHRPSPLVLRFMIRRTKQNEVGVEHTSNDQECSRVFYFDPQTLYTKNLLLDDFRKLSVNVEKKQERLRDPLKIVEDCRPRTSKNMLTPSSRHELCRFKRTRKRVSSTYLT